MTTAQTDANPAPEKEKSSPSYFDRALTIVNLLFLLANSVVGVFLFQTYGRHELMYKRAELEIQEKVHIKHNFETKVTVVNAPNGASPGVFCVSFAAKITNNGTFPFTLGKDTMTLVLGTYDPAKVDNTTPIVVNNPGLEGQITWGTPRNVDAVGRGGPSILFPGEENVAEHSFLVAGPSHAFVHVSYSVPRAMNNKAVEPLNHSHVVHLLEVVKAEDKAWKTK